jgi:transcriptional regulator GlxA family with amidase domain
MINKVDQENVSTTPAINEGVPITFCFLLLKDFSFLSFASLIEPLRMANEVANKQIYAWELVTIDNLPVTASNGISHQPTAQLDESCTRDYLWLVSGTYVRQHYTKAIKYFLRKAQRSNTHIGAASTATFLLAFAGIVNHRRCTIHWESKDLFLEEFPNLNLTGNLFEIDSGVLTCGGGLTCLDLMLELIRQQQSVLLSKKIADFFLYPANRLTTEKQKLSIIEQYKVYNPAVIKTLTHMLAHLQEPKQINQLAQNANVGMRHLERLFQKHFHLDIHTFYMHLRLEKANLLLRETNDNIAVVGEKCGFIAPSYFAKCYKNYYKFTPKETRKRT